MIVTFLCVKGNKPAEDTSICDELFVINLARLNNSPVT
jgi:hypothetical protein